MGRTRRREQTSTRIIFFVIGLGMAAWAPLVPFVQQRAGLDDGALGRLLLCLGGGSIVTMPLAGALAARFGCRRVIVWAVALLCLVLPVLADTGSLLLLVPALLLFGAAIGAMDCTVNIQALAVERASGRPMMSGFHGLFSLGGIVGAAGVSALLGVGASPLAAVLVVVTCVAAALACAAPALLPYGGAGAGPSIAVPRGVVWGLGLLCFIMFLAEGTVLDWGAVFLTAARGVVPAYAGLGYAAFSVAMTAGRLTGDAIVRRLGRRQVVVAGGLCAAAGLAIVVLVPSWPAGLVGYGLLGAGSSNIVPVLFSAVGRQSAMPEHAAVPAVTTLGYFGILAGPAAIGLIAHASSLSAALLIVAALLLAVAASGSLLRV